MIIILSVTICNINIRILYICQLFYIQYTSVIHDCKSAQQCHLPWVLAPWKKMMPKKKRAALAHWSIVFHFLAYYLVQFTYSTYIAIYCVKVTYMLNTMAGSCITVWSASNSQRLYIYRNGKWRNMKQKMILALLLQIHYEIFFCTCLHCMASV